eukprot:gene5451-10955_t
MLHNIPARGTSYSISDNNISSHALISSINNYFTKWLGDVVNIPPRMTSSRALFLTFIGCFIFIASLQSIFTNWNDSFISRGKGSLFQLPVAFGAFSTILFGLPSAPVAQPRVVILAHIYVIAVCTVIIHIFQKGQDSWLQEALAISFSVSGMAGLGILHPPAGAIGLLLIQYFNNTMIYSDIGWLFFIVTILLGCVFGTIVATVMINISPVRRFPIFW